MDTEMENWERESRVMGNKSAKWPKAGQERWRGVEKGDKNRNRCSKSREEEK